MSRKDTGKKDTPIHDYLFDPNIDLSLGSNIEIYEDDTVYDTCQNNENPFPDTNF